jgi:transcriptional regulator with XRE-family HTH domain
MRTDPLGELIRRVLKEAPFAMRQLAADAGLSYDVLRSWRSGRRRPSPASAQRLANGLEERGELLLRLSRELREAAQDRQQRAGRPAAESMAAGGQQQDAGSSAEPAPSDEDGQHGDRPLFGHGGG